jgi:hypothetical protein
MRAIEGLFMAVLLLAGVSTAASLTKAQPPRRKGNDFHFFLWHATMEQLGDDFRLIFA